MPSAPRRGGSPSALERGASLYAQLPQEGAKVGSPAMAPECRAQFIWDDPSVVNDARFRARFPLVPTTVDAGVAAMTEWAKGHRAAKG